MVEEPCLDRGGKGCCEVKLHLRIGLEGGGFDMGGRMLRLGSQSRRLVLCLGQKWLGSGQILIREKGIFERSWQMS